MAGVLFKNVIISCVNEPENCLWVKLDEEMRSNIKQAFLQQLISVERVKYVSICIAILARFEITHGMWPEFLGIMESNATGENMQYRHAAMLTLGQLSEFIEGEPLTQLQVGQMLHSTIVNITSTNLPLTKIAVETLLRLLPSTAECFAIEGQRDYILEGIFTAIRVDDDDIRETAFKALAEVPAVATDIATHLNTIYELTTQIQASDHSESARQALQFWTNMCKFEKQVHVVRGCPGEILSIAFLGVVKTELDDEDRNLPGTQDEEPWTVSQAALSMIHEVCKAAPGMCWTEIWRFFQSNIQ